MDKFETQLLITGGRVLDPEGEELDRPPILDLLIEDGKIVAIGEEALLTGSTRAKRLNASGKLIIPGLINAHYHSHDVLLRGMFEQLPLEAWGLSSFPSNF